MPAAKPQPFVIATIGPVGSGKTYVATILARRLGARHINTDVIRVALRRQHKPENRAIPIANRLQEKLLARGESLILDHDIVNPVRRRELHGRLREFGVKIYFLQIRTPERLILARLRRKRYTGRDLFRNADEAIRVYHFRKKFHRTRQRFTPNFTIDNARPLGPQINRIVKEIKKLRNFWAVGAVV